MGALSARLHTVWRVEGLPMMISEAAKSFLRGAVCFGVLDGCGFPPGDFQGKAARLYALAAARGDIF